MIFVNSIAYLLLVTNRMNTDEEIDPYYSHINPNYVQEPTMNFQTNLLYSQFTTLLTYKLPQNYVTYAHNYSLNLVSVATINFY